MIALPYKLHTLRLFLTAEHPCSYLPGRVARNLVADPMAVDDQVYGELVVLGFRRSGDHIYRPHCADCEACLSLRIPVADFRFNRSQRRTWHRNADLEVQERDPWLYWEHYQLFRRYLRARHPNGGMDDTTPDHYLAFVTSCWSDTRLYEFRCDQRLLAVAVVDRVDDGLSAVYTFFDPLEAARGLGTQAVLWQIAEARRLGLTWVYLGYWVRDCRKMGYKDRFRPHQVFSGGQWLSGDLWIV